MEKGFFKVGWGRGALGHKRAGLVGGCDGRADTSRPALTEDRISLRLARVPDNNNCEWLKHSDAVETSECLIILAHYILSLLKRLLLVKLWF